MTVQRRQFLQSFSSLGAVGAATLALAACGQRPAPGTGVAAPAAAATPNGFLVSKGGRGPALEGPYLDLRTGRGNQLAYARLQGDLEWGKQKYFCDGEIPWPNLKSSARRRECRLPCHLTIPPTLMRRTQESTLPTCGKPSPVRQSQAACRRFSACARS